MFFKTMKVLDRIISESIDRYLSSNLIVEKKSRKDDGKDEKEEADKKDDDLPFRGHERNGSRDEKKDDDSKDKKKKKKFKKNAIKARGGLRKDFDIEDDETYNQNADDQEQSSIEDFLNSGFINKKKVAMEWRPDLTDNGAQSELNKKLNHDKSDSGYTYKLKKKDVKKLRQIIAANLT